MAWSSKDMQQPCLGHTTAPQPQEARVVGTQGRGQCHRTVPGDGIPHPLCQGTHTVGIDASCVLSLSQAVTLVTGFFLLSQPHNAQYFIMYFF